MNRAQSRRGGGHAMTSSLMLDDVTDSCSLGSRSGDVVNPESVLEEEREHLVQVQPSLPPLLLL